MEKVFTPQSEVDLAFVRGLLDEAGIRYFVHNDHFGSLRIGPVIPLFNEKTVMVAPEDEVRARAVIEAYVAEMDASADTSRSDYSWRDRVRMLIEFLLFGWVMPGRRWPRKGDDGNR
ncbi:MAG: DUF2007 domain-containing protein [Nitrospirota bacterium]|jgi:hypothetical protein